MWERRDVVAVRPLTWSAVAGAGGLVPLWALAWWWARPVPDAATAVRLVVLFVAFVAVRGLMAVWYNRTVRWHRGVVLVWSGEELAAAPAGRVFRVALWMTPGAWLMGLACWATGLFPPPPGGWVAFVGIEWPVAQWVLAGGSAWLYTQVVAALSQALTWHERDDGGWQVVSYLHPHRFRVVAGTMVFGWIAAGSVGSILLLMAGLTVLAGHLPAGYFGVGVALFVGLVLALFGLVAAAVLGLWAYLLARAYNAWAARGGGFAYRVRRIGVPVA